MHSRALPLVVGSMMFAVAALAATLPGAQPQSPLTTGRPQTGSPTDRDLVGRLGVANAGPIHDLDQQIKDLKDRFHSQLDPLQAQIKTLRDQFEPQIKTLEDQRHDLVESGKTPMMQDLDKQETSELAALADQEKSEVERVHAHYADARKDVQAKYQQLRAGMKTAR